MEDTNCLNRRIRRMVQVLNAEGKKKADSGIESALDSRRSLVLRIFWILIFALSSLLFLYQALDRLLYFLSQPIQVDVHIKQIQNESLPQLTICSSDTSGVIELMRKANIGSDNIEKCLQLVQALVNTTAGVNYTVSDIWKAINTTTCVTEMEIKNSNVKPHLESLATPHATCATWLSAGNSLAVTFGKPDGTCKMSYITIMYHEPGEQVDYQNTIAVMSGYRLTLGFSLQKYKFINRRNFACALKKGEFTECMEKCRMNIYKELPCRFPFMPRSIQIADCEVSNTSGAHFDRALITFVGFEANSQRCNCLETCEQVYYKVSVASEEALENKTLISFYYHDNYISIISERLAYDFISFCSDFGGCLGLYFGWSTLQIIYGLHVLIEKKTKRVKAPTFRKEDPIFKIVSKVYHRQSTLRKITRINQLFIPDITTICWWIFALLCASSTLYLLIFRMIYYFTFPKVTLLDIKSNAYVQYPVITVFWESDKLVTRKKYFAKKKRLPDICNLTLLDLMDPPFSFSANKIWDFSNAIDSLIIEKLPNRTLDVIYLPSGIGLLFTTGPILHAESYFRFTLVGMHKAAPTNCLYIKVIITPPGEAVDPTRYEIIPQRSITAVKFSLKTLKNNENDEEENLDDRKVTAICKTECIMKKAVAKINCWMPYLVKADHLPPCNTSSSARAVEAAYLEAFVTTNATRDCGCPSLKRELIYSTDIMIQRTAQSASLFAFVFVNTRIENFFTVTAYDIVKFLSEFGGNYSAVLGLSIISTIEAIFSLYKKLVVYRME